MWSKSIAISDNVGRVAARLLAGVALVQMPVAGWAQEAGGASSSAASESPDGPAIVVTGSRLNIGSGSMLPTATTVLNSDLIQSVGISNVGDALLQVPSFVNTNGDQGLNPENIGARLVDLRGLGPQRTLILVDGRRFVPSTQSGAVNLSLVPSALLTRTDVVTGGASAGYGSDAVAGVVNVVLDKRLNGFRADFQKGIAQRGDNATTQASLAGGTSFAGGRGHIVAAAEYERNEGQGDYYSRGWSAKGWCGLLNFDFVNGAPFMPGEPFNVIRPNCATAFISPQGLITGATDTAGAPSFVNSLVGQQFTASGTGVVPFNFGQYPGFFMSGGDGVGQNAFWVGPQMVPQFDRFSFFARSDYEVSQQFRPFVELSYGGVNGRNTGAQGRIGFFTGGGLPIAVDNAFLPQDVRDAMIAEGLSTIEVGKAFNDLGNARGGNRVRTLRAVVGADGDFSPRWHWDAYYQFGQTDYRQTLSNNLITSRLFDAVDAVNVAGSIVCRSGAPGCVPYNPFGAGTFSPAAAAYVTGTSLQDNRIRQKVAAVNLRGEPFRLPGGDLAVAVGAEYRRDSLHGQTDPLSRQAMFYTFNGEDIDGAISVREAYVEVNAPVLADLPLIKSLSVNGAARRTRYSTSGGVTTWKVGGVWEPASFLRLRAARSRDIRAPNIVELFGPKSNGLATLNNYFLDPSGPQVLVPILVGGNPGLEPERSLTSTAGIVLTPIDNGATSLTLSADYYHIRVKGIVGTKGSAAIVADCALLQSAEDCARVTLADDGTTILRVDESAANLNSLTTEGVDFEVNFRHRFDNGSSVSLLLLATYLDKLEIVSPVSTINLAGQSGYYFITQPQTGLPHWRGSSFLTWDSGKGFRATLSNRFIGAGKYNNALIGPQDAGYDAALNGPGFFDTISNNRIGSRLYTGLSLAQKIRFGDSGEFEIYGVVNNLFDVDPPIAPGPSSATNNILFDVVGRSFAIGVRSRF